MSLHPTRTIFRELSEREDHFVADTLTRLSALTMPSRGHLAPACQRNGGESAKVKADRHLGLAWQLPGNGYRKWQVASGKWQKRNVVSIYRAISLTRPLSPGTRPLATCHSTLVPISKASSSCSTQTTLPSSGRCTRRWPIRSHRSALHTIPGAFTSSTSVATCLPSTS